MLSNSFDEKIAANIKVFEGKRIQQLYARMINTQNQVPNFKARLTEMQKERADEIAGFGVVDRRGLPTEKLTMPNRELQKWVEVSEKLTDRPDHASQGLSIPYLLEKSASNTKENILS